MLLLAVTALIATPAAAQVEVQPLAAPDYFSVGAAETGLPRDLWRGTSPGIATAVIPRLATGALSPATARLARQVLATGAAGPGDAGHDPALAAARADALIALGRPRTAWTTLERAQGLQGSATLSRVAAEAALLSGQDAAACRIAEQLTVDRGEIYWLRLRAYCQALAGQTDAAQLTLTLASEKSRDPAISRLIGAVIAGEGDPGAASLRNGLDLALSRKLALDLTEAAKTAPPAVLAALDPAPETFDRPPGEGLGARLAREQGRAAEVDALFVGAVAADAKTKPRYEAAVLVAAALGAPFTDAQRATLARFEIPAGSAAPAKLAGLDLAAGAGLKGETALLALDLVLDAGGKPLKTPDAARVIAALNRVGLTDAARDLADEVLTALQLP